MRDAGVGRLLASGLLAGLVISLGEFVLNGLLLRREWEATMQSLARPPIGGAAIVGLNLSCFGLGIFIVLLASWLQPHFGTPQRSLLTAAVVLWGAAYVIGFGWSVAMGVFSLGLYLPTLAWSLVELPLAAWAAGFLHRGR